LSVQITIIGCGQIGASIGLRLKDQKDKFLRIGHDREPSIARKAEKKGALDKVSLNLHQAVEGADIVVMAEPLNQVEQTMREVATDLKEGVVLLNTAPTHSQAASWATELLPPERFFVSMTPTLKPGYLHEVFEDDSTPHADLFENSLMVITSPRGSHSGALQLAVDVSNLLGAKPFFTDLVEADGLLASIDLLPRLASAALIETISSQPGWRESRKIAGSAFASATSSALTQDNGEDLAAWVSQNRGNAVKLLDDLISQLKMLRDLTAEKDGEALASFISKTHQTRQTWWLNRQSGDWGEGIPKPEVPSGADMLSRLTGIRLKKGKK